MPLLEPVTLSGVAVRLEPLARAHLPALTPVALDPDLWRVTANFGGTPEAFAEWLDEALAHQAVGGALPFVLIDPVTDQPIGSTRYGNYDAPSARVEIGWTWVARPWQRTRVNTEAKYLLLRHAFETLALERVELKTDAINARSRAAILRIGATQEGILRRHQRTWDGRLRDTVFFSVLKEEWPAVKARLESMLAPAQRATTDDA
jgi:RimJ/RimL family protein N-acetyltransferase